MLYPGPKVTSLSVVWRSQVKNDWRHRNDIYILESDPFKLPLKFDYLIVHLHSY